MKNRNFCYKWGRKFFELCWFWKKFGGILFCGAEILGNFVILSVAKNP